MILAGVAIWFFFSAITSFLTLTATDSHAARRVLEWMLGGLAGTTWTELPLLALILVLGIIYLVLQSRSLNALLVGEETAKTLGVDTNRFRRKLFLITALLTGVMVAVSGAIGFVGLMMPHIVRIGVGADHRRVLPVCTLAGSIFLVWVDVLARIVIEPQELPVGIITALIGAPFYLILMRQTSDQLRGSR
jgi:iron complex transport system permease protein